MVEVSAEGSSLIAQVMAVIVFASIIELRKALRAQTLWEMWVLCGLLLVCGTGVSGGLLVSRIADAASGTVKFEAPLGLFWWIALQFVIPLGVLVTAEALKLGGKQISGKVTGEPVKRNWVYRELSAAIKRNAGSRT